MNWFQIITLAILGSIALYKLIVATQERRIGSSSRKFVALIALACLAIARPDIVQQVAAALGIGRGADLVQYIAALSSLFLFYVLYARYVSLSRSMTALARHIAISQAREPARTDASE